MFAVDIDQAALDETAGLVEGTIVIGRVDESDPEECDAVVERRRRAGSAPG